jgi:hypothetical protein
MTNSTGTRASHLIIPNVHTELPFIEFLSSVLLIGQEQLGVRSLTLNSPATLPGENLSVWGGGGGGTDVGGNVDFVHKRCANVGRNIYSDIVPPCQLEGNR